GVAAQFFRAVGTGGKRPGPVTALTQIRLVLPQFRLQAAHIDQYHALCGFESRQGVSLLYPQLLTFPLVMAYVCSDDCPWPALGTVHLANAIAQQEPLHAGDTVRVELCSGALLAHDKGQVFCLDLAVWRGDTQVWSATQSLLRVGVQPAQGPAFRSQLDAGPALSYQTGFKAAADIGRRYGVVSGDRNPIHLSAWTARLFGFRRAIAHGMWTQARALSYLLPQRPVQQARLAVEFKTPLFLPGSAALWSARSAEGASFEVRDASGTRPHLRGQLRF
ncbi:MAG: MaoC/PaaZ C-terminal domain-containing protein, partial [Rhodoferax sp.]